MASLQGFWCTQQITRPQLLVLSFTLCVEMWWQWCQGRIATNAITEEIEKPILNISKKLGHRHLFLKQSCKQDNLYTDLYTAVSINGAFTDEQVTLTTYPHIRDVWTRSYPSCHWPKSSEHPGRDYYHRDHTVRQQFMLTITPMINLESPVNPTRMSLDCWRKPRYPGKAHANGMRTCKHHTKPSAWCWLSCFEATVLNTAPSCCRALWTLRW